ncbi:hypothetical protein ACJIZ3_021886 [Penstemon smallii]|uniref:Uncharacterized protein n=1 Tax=Penstemon smallii TaxID=265156 RepID=A0ABD3SMQ6_9LAMI
MKTLTHTEEARRIKNGWIKTSEEEANSPKMEEAVRSFEVAMLVTSTKREGISIYIPLIFRTVQWVYYLLCFQCWVELPVLCRV